MAKLRILLIEPDYLLASTIRQYLEASDMSVDICHEAQSAVNMIDKKRPNLIILEPQLSVHDGYEFLYELRSYPEWQDISVIIYSLTPPDILAITEQSKKQLGIIECLYKPTTSLSKLAFNARSSLYALST